MVNGAEKPRLARGGRGSEGSIRRFFLASHRIWAATTINRSSRCVHWAEMANFDEGFLSLSFAHFWGKRVEPHHDDALLDLGLPADGGQYGPRDQACDRVGQRLATAIAGDIIAPSVAASGFSHHLSVISAITACKSGVNGRADNNGGKFSSRFPQDFPAIQALGGSAMKNVQSGMSFAFRWFPPRRTVADYSERKDD